MHLQQSPSLDYWSLYLEDILRDYMGAPAVPRGRSGFEGEAWQCVTGDWSDLMRYGLRALVHMVRVRRPRRITGVWVRYACAHWEAGVSYVPTV